MAYTPVTGNDGRIRVGSNVTVSGLKSWKMTKTTVVVMVPHFESATDGDGNVWPAALRGLSGATFTADGWMDTDATTATDSGTPGLSNGLTISADLILVKATPFGFSNVSAIISQIEIGTAIDANQPAPFSLQATVSGTPGKTGTVS